MPDIAAFVAGVRRTETGGDGIYDAQGDKIRSGRKIGAYGFPSDEWTQLAKDAGMPGAPWQNPRVQDEVARRTFQALYQKYYDWRLVAVAWKAGERVADVVAANPGLLQSPELAEVKTYVESVIQSSATDDAGAPVAAMAYATDMASLQPNPSFISEQDDRQGHSPARQAVVTALMALRENARREYQSQLGSREPNQPEGEVIDSGN